MPKCIFCDNELMPDTKPEHVLLSAWRPDDHAQRHLFKALQRVRQVDG